MSIILRGWLHTEWTKAQSCCEWMKMQLVSSQSVMVLTSDRSMRCLQLVNKCHRFYVRAAGSGKTFLNLDVASDSPRLCSLTERRPHDYLCVQMLLQLVSYTSNGPVYSFKTLIGRYFINLSANAAALLKLYEVSNSTLILLESKKNLLEVN